MKIFCVRHWAGVNEPTTAASLCLLSQEEGMPWCHENYWTKAGWYPLWFSLLLQHYRTIFHSSAKFREILGACQRSTDMFCRPWESILPVPLEKLCGCYGSTVLTGLLAVT